MPHRKKSLRIVIAALFVALFFAPVPVRAEDCASGDAQIYFDTVNEFMEAQGREAFSWNDTLAETAEKIATLNSQKGSLRDFSQQEIISEDAYDLNRVAMNATNGGSDIKKAFQRNLSDFKRFLLPRYFKEAGTACVAGKKGPYRALVVGLQKRDLPESERSKCGPGFARAVLSYTNDYRRLMKLPPVTWNDQLAEAAETHAAYMAEIDNAQHAGPGGHDVTNRVAFQGYAYRMVSENVASGPETPLKVVMAWRKSPGHDENLRSPDATEMGAACSDRPHTRYQIFWAQVFGKPLKKQ